MLVEKQQAKICGVKDRLEIGPLSGVRLAVPPALHPGSTLPTGCFLVLCARFPVSGCQQFHGAGQSVKHFCLEGLLPDRLAHALPEFRQELPGRFNVGL
jgi:hypothetical protein